MTLNKFSIIFVVATTLAYGCQNKKTHEELIASENREQVEYIMGPHNGKLFQKDDFGLEVTIYEPDLPPQSRVYFYEDGKIIDPSQVSLVMELHRIDRLDTFNYTKQDDYLLGDKIVEEPHSFDVKLSASYKGKNYNWSYPSYEGRTTLSDKAIESTGIKIEKASSATITSSIILNARIEPDRQKITKLAARFPGVVKEIKKPQGSKVEKGDVVASIEANESLKTYNIIAPLSGEIIEISYAVGEIVSENDYVLTIGDLSSVWLELTVPMADFAKLKIGQTVLLESEQIEKQEGKIIYISPIADGDTQSFLARAEIANPTKSLIPELFVEAKIIIEQREVPVAVKAEALHKFRDWDVVFKKVGQIFEIAILELGEVDGDLVEVKSGLLPGADYVTENSFVVKADVMKSGATHDH